MVMRKMFKVLGISLVAMMTINTVPAYAGTSEIAGGAIAAVEGAKELYEGSVVYRMAGRAGAAGKGAKGIAFETIYSDMKNFANATKDKVTGFTKNSTATQVDLVTKDGAGKVVERIQCKDTPSPSGIKDTISKVKSGKYDGAQLVGTKETAEAYAEEAAKNGVKKTMENSGVSTETTKRIANKALGVMPSAKEICNTAANGGAVGAAVDGGIALVESIVNKDDLPDTVGHTGYHAVEGAVTGAGAAVAGEVVAAGVGAAGLGGAAPVVVPAVACAGAATAINYGAKELNKKYDIEGKISDGTRYINEKYDIENRVKQGSQNVSTAVTKGAKSATLVAAEGAKRASEITKNAVDTVTKGFKK